MLEQERAAGRGVERVVGERNGADRTPFFGPPRVRVTGSLYGRRGVPKLAFRFNRRAIDSAKY